MDENSCEVLLNDCPKARRCFMTGEYCSKQTEIQQVREKLHGKNEINAFVIMNFSNMSDVVYEWRLKPFIERLKDDLVFSCDSCDNSNKRKLICRKKTQQKEEKQEVPVTRIHVIRADSSFESNFIICNRICQLMQVADLIVVDVSVKNANVFYEFGMAVAMGKLILPVCFSESFYNRVVPEYLKKEDPNCESIMTHTSYLNKIEHENVDSNDSNTDVAEKKNHIKNVSLEHHIGMFPWRKRLFENFGIKHIEETSQTGYTDFTNIIREEYGFDDIFYNYFPYDSRRWKSQNGSNQNKTIGQMIYERLHNTYNISTSNDNTVVIYTMEEFLHADNAAVCIANFYLYFTRKVKEYECFCGDRVGVLAQSSHIPEQDKDDSEENKRNILYSTGQAIHIGVNQATFVTQQRIIKPMEYLVDSTDSKPILSFVKEYLGNKAMLIYPYTPVYCKRIELGIQPPIFELSAGENSSSSSVNGNLMEHYFCLFHMMLRNLQYVREIIVDISNASLEGLFWLGMAHGADVPAISVKRKETLFEKVSTSGSPHGQERTIMDIAGLWYAEFCSEDTETFYRHLLFAHQEIEQHAKLLLPDTFHFEDHIINELYRTGEQENQKNARSNLQKEMSVQLESYYRNRLWNVMLQDNRLKIYTYKRNEEVLVADNKKKVAYETECIADISNKIRGLFSWCENKNRCPLTKKLTQNLTTDVHANVSIWDFMATSLLSRYLTRRTRVGQYEIIGWNENEQENSTKIENSNFIGVGAYSMLFQKHLGEIKNTKQKDHIDALWDKKTATLWGEKKDCCKFNCFQKAKCDYRGFKQDDQYYYTQLDTPCCPRDKKSNSNEKKENCVLEIKPSGGTLDTCQLTQSDKHLQIGQLLLWREDVEDEDRHFYISLVGVSGPATYALASLLVSNPLKKEVYNAGGDSSQWNYLSLLQQHIRKEFIDQFSKGNTDLMNSVLGKAAKLYLSATLYLYYIPFLTVENQKRIVNSMLYFLTSFCVSQSSSLNTEQADSSKIRGIIGELQKMLDEFCCVEALYQVEVSIEENTSDSRYDTRKVQSIKPIQLKDNHWIKIYQKVPVKYHCTGENGKETV